MVNKHDLKKIDHLLDKYAVYTGDLSDYIYTIRKKYGKYIKPPEKGIYWVDGLRPIIKPNDMVYLASRYERQECFDIRMFKDLNEPLLDAGANTLLSEGMVRNKHHLLRETPNLDVRVIEIIAILVKNVISNLVLHNAYDTPLSQLKEHLKDAGHFLIDRGSLQQCCLPLLEEIDYFVGHHQWNIYSTEIESVRIHVSKCIDYRIMDWTQRMASGEWRDYNYGD